MHTPMRVLLGALFAVAGVTPATALAATSKAALQAGEEVYSRCLACHALAYDRTGPRHCGLFGRRAGSVAGFAYSDAMKNYGVVWNAKTLDHFLRNPFKAVPGTSMGYAGVTDNNESPALLAYMKAAHESARSTHSH